MTTDSVGALARRIQQSILPYEQPKFEGYDIKGSMIPANGIAGDFYGYVPLPNPNKIILYVGDVVDKGLAAGLYMMWANGILRGGISCIMYMSPVDTLLWLNEKMMQAQYTEHNMHLTMIYGVLDTSTHEFNFARAGHPRAYVIDAEGNTLYRGNGIGQPLGLLENPKIDKDRCRIPPESFLALYTDGIAEETNQMDQEFGQRRLEQLLKENRRKNAAGICAAVSEGLFDYRGVTTQNDDCTLMIGKRLS